MTVNIPTKSQVVNDIATELTNTTGLNALNENFLRGLTYALAVGIANYYLISKKIFDNLFIATADETYTLLWASWFGIARRTATKASGYVILTGTAGGSVPSGTTIATASGLEYTTLSNANLSTQSITLLSLTRSGSLATATTLTDHNLGNGMQVVISGANETDFNGTFTITVISNKQFTYTVSGTPSTPATGTILATGDYAKVQIEASDYGSDYNLANGSILTLGSPVVDVDDIIRVLYDGITGGLDVETVANVKTRLQSKISNLSTAYSVAGLKQFIKQNFSTITRVWVFGANVQTKTVNVSSLSSDANGVATITLASSISFLDGTDITISGANETDFNITKQGIQTANNKIVYCLDNATALSATGTIAMSYTDIEAGYTRIYFTQDNESSIIPSSTKLIKVKNAIVGNTTGITGILPANTPEAYCQVVAPTSVSVDITFSGLTPSTDDMKNSITSALQNYFKSDSVAVGQDVKLDNIKGVISNVIDSSGNTPLFTLSSPATDVSIDGGELAILGTITF